MRQQGTHTWDITIHYHRCPACGFIIESRHDYQYRLGKYKKDLICKRCQNHFTVMKSTHPKLGPLIGKPQPVETEWE